MRDHVAAHILSGHFGDDPELCGFCGEIGHIVTLFISSGSDTWSVKSNCTYWYDFNLKALETSTSNSPSTNRPVKCLICPPPLNIFWSYNLKAHYEIKHSLLTVQENGIIDAQAKTTTLALLKQKKNV